MSRENVELVWRAAKAFNDDDDLDWFTVRSRRLHLLGGAALAVSVGVA
jgi:hypothetical protein